MIKTIRRPNLFSLYDRSGIVRYLKKMAARGWLVCDIRSPLWKFKRIEPQELDFSINYDRKGEAYDLSTNDRQQGLIDMSAEAGWNLAAAAPVITIFWTDRPDAVPMQTDPDTELRSIRSIMRKSMRLEAICLILIILPNMLKNRTLLRVLPIDMITDKLFVWSIVAALFLIVSAAVKWVTYLLWRRKADIAAQTGEFTKTPSTSFANVLTAVIFAVIVIGAVSALYREYSGDTFAVLAAVVLSIAAALAAMSLARRMLKNKALSAGKNLAVVFISGFVAWAAVFSICVSLTGRYALPIENKTPPVDLPVEISIDGIPSAPAGSYKTTQKHKATFIAESHIVEQDAADGSGTPYVRYRITEIKTGLFRNSIIKKAMERFNSGRSVTENASLWGADRALQATVYSGTRSNYMLVYGNYILDIDFSWEPTAEQKAYIGQIMKGIVSGQ